MRKMVDGTKGKEITEDEFKEADILGSVCPRFNLFEKDLFHHIITIW